MDNATSTAGYIHMHVENELRSHLAHILHDPVSLWSTLENVCCTLDSGTHAAPSQKLDMEYAGNASALATGNTNRPDFSSDFDCIADTGATSHMTPHRDWIADYKPYRVAVRLADDNIVYSEGVGSVVFHPVINGKKADSVEITRVLHIPKL